MPHGRRRTELLMLAFAVGVVLFAYANWVAHKPRPVKTTRRVGGKTVTTTTTTPYRLGPTEPEGCTQGMSG